MFKWFRKLRYIVKNFDTITNGIEAKAKLAIMTANQSVDIIKERTDIHLDLSVMGHDPHQIVLIGQYRNRDYFQIYSLHTEDFSGLVEDMRHRCKYGKIKRIDNAPNLHVVKQTLEHEGLLERW